MEGAKELESERNWQRVPLTLSSGPPHSSPEVISDDPKLPFLRQFSTHLSNLTENPSQAPRIIKSLIADYSQGWRFGVLCSTFLGTAIGIVNLVFTIWTFTVPVDGVSVYNSVVTIYEGNCSTINRGNTFIKLAVSIFATLLFAGSNYCMQVLSSPTREEINKAHRHHTWLTVGLIYNFSDIDHGVLWAQQPVDAFDTKWVYGTQNWNERCDPGHVAEHNRTTWTPFQFNTTSTKFSSVEALMESHVNYCLAQKIQQPCKLSATPIMFLVVLIANILKVLGYVGTLWVVDRRSAPLVTNDDAIQSFLKEPDPYLKDRCLATASQAQKNSFWSATPLPKVWRPRTVRWLQGAPLSLWLLAYLPAIGLLGAIIGVCAEQSVWTDGLYGFGSPTINQIISKGDSNNYGVLSTTLLANSPQIVTSYCYCAFNALLSNMVANEEWTSYSLRHKGLKVTRPLGSQRKTYYHQLPRRYAIPFVALSALLHW